MLNFITRLVGVRPLNIHKCNGVHTISRWPISNFTIAPALAHWNWIEQSYTWRFAIAIQFRWNCWATVVCWIRSLYQTGQFFLFAGILFGRFTFEQTIPHVCQFNLKLFVWYSCLSLKMVVDLIICRVLARNWTSKWSRAQHCGHNRGPRNKRIHIELIEIDGHTHNGPHGLTRTHALLNECQAA